MTNPTTRPPGSPFQRGAKDLGHYPGYSWGTVGVRVGYGWGTGGVRPPADFPEWGTGGVRLGYSWGTGGVRWEIFGKPALTGSNWLYLTI